MGGGVRAALVGWKNLVPPSPRHHSAGSPLSCNVAPSSARKAAQYSCSQTMTAMRCNEFFFLFLPKLGVYGDVELAVRSSPPCAAITKVLNIPEEKPLIPAAVLDIIDETLRGVNGFNDLVSTSTI
ncbi:hypothetical protein PHYPSEUDO_004241 [Phytophthora pseudosyringae]|uniref:Uncharacterized protein n=1 Tax=Phytophthora pseudosyringae TaxID=221518 RepID=A0A8T1VPN6_9STRA|nr:hypothetical protein PHYPSEUDO_004241 [Phytophthora pseudosyringae]